MALTFSSYQGRKIRLFLIIVFIFVFTICTCLLLKNNEFSPVSTDHRMLEDKLVSWRNYGDVVINKVGYGEMGVAVTEFSKEKYPNEVTSAYYVYGFNQFLSDKISVNRTLSDYRDPLCKKKKYALKLPSVSVIIVFYDEGMSTLYRTVYSVVNRSPPEIIHEIILVDDHSTLDHLQKPLDDWVASFNGKVKLLRLAVHNGLITAKNAGASIATGKVLIFLDSHCEASIGWLQPLLDPIVLDYRVVTAPIIDVINHDTFQYRPVYNRVRGTFSWLFYYKERDERKKSNTDDITTNIRSPVMAGGLFAISKRWWNEIGEYDPELYVWGGEQYEISFKIWMCGGTLLNVPCSHVGHVYRGPGLHRDQQDIHIRHPNSLMTNYKRVAEVWMDDYKHFLYNNQRSIAAADVGRGIERQKQLRQSLQCKSFQWYLTNIIDDTLETRYEPDLGYGTVSNNADTDGICICSQGLNAPLAYQSCNSCRNIWRYTWIGEFKEDEHCWDYDDRKKIIFNRFCHELRGIETYFIRVCAQSMCYSKQIQ